MKVSIHAPYAGSDVSTSTGSHIFGLFQSTPPMQGATASVSGNTGTKLFQSTPPMQGATAGVGIRPHHTGVSIHAPYAGSDSVSRILRSRQSRFNPRPLCRERQNNQLYCSRKDRFQSTPPMQGATIYDNLLQFTDVVSIHAPYAGSDDLGILGR